MFSAPRFIAVDDKKEHLDAIITSFHRMGESCVGILFTPEEAVDPSFFRGVRCIFMDLHLVSGQKGTSHNGDFGRIQTILEDSISSTGGPFMLVMWTAYPELRGELVDYLERNIRPEMVHAKPLAVLSLAKDKFIKDLSGGDLTDRFALRDAIKAAVLESPQLAALLGWEADVSRAAGATLASLLSLVPSEKRTAEGFSKELDKILSRLVREAVGSAHVNASPRAAVSTALAPILADRILHQDVEDGARENWEKAVTLHLDKKLEPASLLEAAGINRMLHLALPSSESLSATNWGAVIAWPFEWTDDKLAEYTDMSRTQMLGGEFKVRSAELGRCQPVLVRVGAACDYAQNRMGPITYLFGMIIPVDAARQKKNNKDGIEGDVLKPSDAVWESPIFDFPGAGVASRLYVHIRFPQTHLPKKTSEWKVLCRLREQLLTHLISAASSYVARPGIVQLFSA